MLWILKTIAGAQADDDAFSFSYDYRLGLKTSFTGKDLLFARLRAGNMKDGCAFSAGFRKLDVSGMSGNDVKLDRLYYKFPVGSGLTAVVGPMARNTESLGMKPTAYTVKTLNMFGGQFGAGNVYNKETGGLVGVIWKQKVAKGEPRLTAALNYVADDGEQASSEKGMFTAESKGNTTAQIGYGTKQWGAALGYRYGQCGAGFGTAYFAAGCPSQSCGDNVDSQNFALNGFWKPEETGFIPSVSLAYGWSDLEGSTVDKRHQALGWWVCSGTRLPILNAAWLLVSVSPSRMSSPKTVTDPDAPELAWEASLKYKVSKNITLIPAIFYLPESSSNQGESGYEQFGAVLQTVFKF